MKTATAKMLKVACIGGFAFWAPDTIVHVIRRTSFSGADVRFLTLAMPLAALVALLVWARVTGDTRSVTAGRMLVGVWLLGGVFMMISATIAGGGFSGPDGFKGGLIAIAMSLIPIYTFIMATYDGSLFALLLISMALFLVWVLPMSMGQRNAKA